MINECGHPLCKNCVDNLFARNAAPCHKCGRTLRKNTFWEQVFDDPSIEKENHVRKRLKKIYNLKFEDFPSLRDFNDYLERLEHIVFNLTEEIDVDQTEAEINAFRDGNAELIERNRRRYDADTTWVLDNLKEEKEMKNRMNTVHQQENKEDELTAVRDTKAIIDEIKDSDVPAEVILDRERKRQIEIDMEQKEKAADKKRRLKEAQSHRRPAELSFGHQAQRAAGRTYEYRALRLIYNGPPLIPREALEPKGYLSHIKAPSKHRLAGGYTAHLGLERALFESRVDLLSF
ncbi:unnamed protein product [Auanema sp. JU1783]|nr:unnamed protein product [Auanema sp. JU1783]